jgi:hypothetical protein
MSEKDERLQGVTSHQHETWAAGRRRYDRAMGRGIEERIWADRALLMTRYLNNPGVFPSGPDGRAWGIEAWYVPGEWRLVGGKAVRVVAEGVTSRGVTGKKASVTEAVVTAVGEHVEGGAGALSDAERARRYRERLKAARAVLKGVEDRVRK